MKLIGLAVLFTVICASAEYLDTHNSPFASPPYSWTEFDTKSYEASQLIEKVGQSLSMQLLMKGIGPAQIIQTNAIWARESMTNVNKDFIIKSYILYNYVVIARIGTSEDIFECMTPVEESTPVNRRWDPSTNKIFTTTCRLIPVRKCTPTENQIVIDPKSPPALEARQAINNFIDKTLNPTRFEQLLYKVDVLMGVPCAYKQDNKICLDLYEQRISDDSVELRPCSGCMEKKADGTWDFGQPTCYPGNPLIIENY